MHSPFSIAIDGPAGAGKSSVAKALARSLDAMYLDTGAMYRAIGLAMHRAGIDLHAQEAVAAAIDGIELSVRYLGGEQHVFLGDEDVTRVIRKPEVSMLASAVSAVPRVRERMVSMQRQIAAGQSVVMDGRDIGTKVLPNATLKVFLTASAKERALRRCREMEAKGTPEAYEKVLEDIIARDRQDIEREASPLVQAPDAVVVDSSRLTLEETVQTIRALAEAAIAAE